MKSWPASLHFTLQACVRAYTWEVYYEGFCVHLFVFCQSKAGHDGVKKPPSQSSVNTYVNKYLPAHAGASCVLRLFMDFEDVCLLLNTKPKLVYIMAWPR